ncbi:hypothetical protein [Streptomyces soliscabiei]|uniref:hypothetical protein n=1 Tax=Streptomyces soliscabiei TaxID=588897 RepID=UPI0029A4F2C8|nr:hypothetical protein [Streptomyces sp. NY05-11A]MDX2677300.1 hypothetical protein [Streptomyces sp. NY05-11A]
MPGTVLLLAASPAGKGCLVDAASVLPVLAAVPPSVLAGTDTANVVELVDPLEPQAVLTRLRAAAAAPGPLTLFVAGQLQLDRRQRLPHLALARTTPSTVRYTALPWHWLREELRLRAAGTTTVVLDLRADAEVWEWLRGNVLDCGVGVAMYGRVAQPPARGRRTVASPSYMKAVATILRSGGRPELEQLHQMALSRIGGEGETGDLLLYTPAAPVVAPGVPATPAAPAAPAAPVVAAGPAVPGPSAVPGAPAVSTVPGVPATPAAPGVSVGPGALAPSGVPALPVGPGASATPAAPVVPTVPASPARFRSTGAVVPGPAVRSGGERPRTSSDGAEGDPHARISAAVQAGRHVDADAIAARCEQVAAVEHGGGSEESLHWAEVRADLAMFAGDAERSCRTWMAVAAARLEAGQPVDAPAVEAAVDRAHHQWGRIGAAERARELGPELAELRARVPGRREGALDHVQQQLRQLQTQG